jgi:hypothetical protein
MKKVLLLSSALVLMLFFSTCKDDEPAKTGKLTLHFGELVDYVPLVTDSMKYTNEAGNEYLVTEVQYFISNVRISVRDEADYLVTQDNGIHYIDHDLPETKTWVIDGDISAGIIDSISFTFGLDEISNQTGLFVNPPESNMYWPDALGGGYHYMKMNGKWLDVNDQIQMFNFHLGIGQTYDTLGTVTGFVQNYFRVNCTMPVLSSYLPVIQADSMNHIAVYMLIDSWFKTPHTWDFNLMGGMMMQNEEAMKMACENGSDVFTLGPLYVD